MPSHPRLLRTIAVVLATGVATGMAPVLTTTAGGAVLQAQSAADTTAPLITPIPRAARPSVIVMTFDFAAALSTEDRDELTALGAIAAALKGNHDAGASQQTGVNLGKATADLLVERLIQSANFRVFERRALEQLLAEQNLTASDRAAAGQEVAAKAKLLGARYMVTGSITKFARSKKKTGSILGAVSKVAIGVSIESQETAYEVGLTARIVDTSSGEVITSMSTEGVVIGNKSRLFGGMAVGGGAGLGGLGGSSTTGEREKRIAESLGLAVDKLTLKMVDARKAGDLEPDPAKLDGTTVQTTP